MREIQLTQGKVALVDDEDFGVETTIDVKPASTYKPLYSVQSFETVPWQFLDELITFYCDKPEPDILDPTCNKRRMWGKSAHLQSKKFVAMDIDPSVKPDVVGDNTNTPFANASFDIIAYDPPHTGDQGKSKTEFAGKYGIGVSSQNPRDGEVGKLVPHLSSVSR